ncbi:MAG: site-specific integrase, partial [Coleofasciculaceae cyanobacterium]
LKTQPLKPETQKRRLEAIAAAWKWAVEENLVMANPWTKIPKVDVPDIEGAHPFTKEECEKICKAIGELRPCSNFVPFVKFMIGCGSRPGEAIGLRWGDVTDNFSKVTIRSQFTKGERKAPKKNKIRKFRVSTEIQGLLEQLFLNAQHPTPEILIFANKGKPIDLDHFREDVWKPALKKARVTYRPPKNCRHTFVSTMLEAGVNPVLVSKITGHDTAVMFKNYAGLLSEPAIPDF